MTLLEVSLAAVLMLVLLSVAGTMLVGTQRLYARTDAARDRFTALHESMARICEDLRIAPGKDLVHSEGRLLLKSPLAADGRLVSSSNCNPSYQRYIFYYTWESRLFRRELPLSEQTSDLDVWCDGSGTPLVAGVDQFTTTAKDTTGNNWLITLTLDDQRSAVRRVFTWTF